MPKTKLELTWPGKEERPRLEPRILLEHPERGHHAAERREGDLFDNMLIKGDNLLALKALEQDYAGKVKCVFIDPPYNTGSAFEHYDDGLEHSIWLSLVKDRLEAIKVLLAPDGYIFVQIDDNEVSYLQVLMDEVFGRRNRVNTIVVKMSESSGVKMSHVERRLPKLKEYILCYRGGEERSLKPVRMLKEGDKLDAYLKYYGKVIENPDSAPEQWQISSIKDFLEAQGRNSSADAIRQFKIENAERVVYRTNNKALAALSFKSEVALVTSATGLSYYWWEGKQMLFLSDYINETLGDLWTDISTINLNKEGQVDFPNGKKPEALIERILSMTTGSRDLVLDSFAGSGTTGAVAHKMGRRWIMVEIGDHADTHIVPRLTKVIDGEDQGGVTKAVGWEGGGGFRYYTLAPSLLERDAYDNWVIAPEYNGPMLAEAMCKHLGFTYDPAQDEAEWWRHGRSSERDFLYVTTQALTHEALRLLSEEMGPDRSLLVCARAFSGNIDAFENLTCRKIPATILTKCEWGRDDYSLNVAALPEREDEAPPPTRAADVGPLFASEDANG